MQCAAEPAAFGIEAALIDLNFVAFVDGALNSVSKRRNANEHARVVLQGLNAPFDSQDEVTKRRWLIPENAGTAIALDDTAGLSETAGAGHAPTRQVDG